jgi:hypothetical protein
MAAVFISFIFGFTVPAKAQGNDYTLDVAHTDDDVNHINELSVNETNRWAQGQSPSNLGFVPPR